MTLQVQVADGKMITALEHPPPGLTIGDVAAKPQDGFIVWDVREPDRPQLLGQWVSGGTGAHRNFYNGGSFVMGLLEAKSSDTTTLDHDDP